MNSRSIISDTNMRIHCVLNFGSKLWGRIAIPIDVDATLEPRIFSGLQLCGRTKLWLSVLARELAPNIENTNVGVCNALNVLQRGVCILEL